MASLMGMAKNFVIDNVPKLKVPEATVTDVDFKCVGRDGVTYLAKVNVQNPYRTPIPICEITYVLKSAGSQIASGTIPDPGSLKGSATTLLNVPVKVAHSVLLSLVKDVGRDWDIDYELQICLIIDLPILGNFTIPLSSAGEIKLPTLSDLWKSN